jgi:hypothetical protein
VYIESRKALEFKMVRAKNIDILREPRASDPDAVSVRRSSSKIVLLCNVTALGPKRISC